MSPETISTAKFVSEWAGSLGLFLGYAIVARGWCSPKATVAIMLNIIGSGGFIVLNWLFQSWPAVFVNVLWFSIGWYSLGSKLLNRQKA